jgi:hypothetical protein
MRAQILPINACPNACPNTPKEQILNIFILRKYKQVEDDFLQTKKIK